MLAFAVPQFMREQFDALVAKERSQNPVTLQAATLHVAAKVVRAGLEALSR